MERICLISSDEAAKKRRVIQQLTMFMALGEVLNPHPKIFFNPLEVFENEQQENSQGQETR